MSTHYHDMGNFYTRTGNSGEKDIFLVDENSGADVIYLFDAGQDIISLLGFSSAIPWDVLQGCISQQGIDTVINLSQWGGGTIRLKGFESGSLTADNFALPSMSTISGGDSRDQLHGDAADNLILGGGGDDVITGGQGNDVIVGGQGNDFIYGDGPSSSGGRDTFVYAPGGGNDTIQDFTNGDDRIDLSAFSGINGFSDITARQVGGKVVIDFSDHGGGSITLKNFNLSDLDEEDFVFQGDADAYDG